MVPQCRGPQQTPRARVPRLLQASPDPSLNPFTRSRSFSFASAPVGCRRLTPRPGDPVARPPRHHCPGDPRPSCCPGRPVTTMRRRFSGQQGLDPGLCPRRSCSSHKHRLRARCMSRRRIQASPCRVRPPQPRLAPAVESFSRGTEAQARQRTPVPLREGRGIGHRGRDGGRRRAARCGDGGEALADGVGLDARPGCGHRPRRCGHQPPCSRAASRSASSFTNPRNRAVPPPARPAAGRRSRGPAPRSHAGLGEVPADWRSRSTGVRWRTRRSRHAVQHRGPPAAPRPSPGRSAWMAGSTASQIAAASGWCCSCRREVGLDVRAGINEQPHAAQRMQLAGEVVRCCAGLRHTHKTGLQPGKEGRAARGAAAGRPQGRRCQMRPRREPGRRAREHRGRMPS